ncbi:hypothetical protein QBC32DRAFT_4186 [Pseudoneurospora amorphoporcata]|uniref:Uncharacterized protein n=1 Tax=Pseudoneurospora amorphoporcata TaxID=241081 RepID=A0AAN6SF84_9PEZI|nr:hypothetical protein QBC32DRAFT_4186 [Pseudoneurospora amorphoporcata]
MLSEPGSTVKHARWTWTDCMVGDGDSEHDRGSYNISIRQSFRLNGEDHYTIFDLPISVTNGISKSDDRPSCQSLDNPLLAPEDIDWTDTNELGGLFAPGGSTVIETPDAGSGAALASCKDALDLLYVVGFCYALLLS